MYSEALLLFTAFAFVHSLMAAESIKNRVPLSEKNYRLLYNTVSVLTFLPFFHFWLFNRAKSDVLFQVSGFGALSLLFLKLVGLVIFAIAFYQAGVLEFLGLREQRTRVVDSGLYGMVRHPQYLGGIIFLWASPELRALDIECYALVTLYLIVGGWLEERKLIKQLKGYEEYRRRVPFLIPRLR